MEAVWGKDGGDSTTEVTPIQKVDSWHFSASVGSARQRSRTGGTLIWTTSADSVRLVGGSEP